VEQKAQNTDRKKTGPGGNSGKKKKRISLTEKKKGSDAKQTAQRARQGDKSPADPHKKPGNKKKNRGGRPTLKLALRRTGRCADPQMDHYERERPMQGEKKLKVSGNQAGRIQTRRVKE